ncbi:MAG: PEP-CTERM sorting domain-containing protein, partial [Planctomycetota bacterium]
GADDVDGGDGNDDIDGGNANDTVQGGRGDDAVAGGAGDDSVDGGSGADDTDIDAAESSNGILVSFNQSNVAGVGDFGAPFVSDPALVGTGIELIVPLTEIGSPTGDIRITAFINGNGHTFLSNQLGGPLPVGTGNLGDPGDVNLSLIDGDQFVTVPEPAGMALVGVGGLAMLGRRRE